MQPISQVRNAYPFVACFVHSSNEDVQSQKEEASESCAEEGFDAFPSPVFVECEEGKQSVAEIIPNLMFFLDKWTAANRDDEEKVPDNEKVQQIVLKQSEQFVAFNLGVDDAKNDFKYHIHDCQDEVRFEVVGLIENFIYD